MNGARYVVLFGQQGHPLATSRGELFEHRSVLYAKIGPGSHPCHFCGKVVTWRKRAPGTGPARDDLHVEHLDGNTVNNDPSNLAPVCQPCNVSAGFRSDRIAPSELVVVRPSGMTTRAVTVECGHCGEPFAAEPSAHRQFCSKVCADLAKVVSVCKRGHPRRPENTYFYGDGKSRCRPCANLASARFRAKT